MDRDTDEFYLLLKNLSQVIKTTGNLNVSREIRDQIKVN